VIASNSSGVIPVTGSNASTDSDTPSETTGRVIYHSVAVLCAGGIGSAAKFVCGDRSRRARLHLGLEPRPQGRAAVSSS
jgi:hypothetical protein